VEELTYFHHKGMLFSRTILVVADFVQPHCTICPRYYYFSNRRFNDDPGIPSAVPQGVQQLNEVFRRYPRLLRWQPSIMPNSDWQKNDVQNDAYA
jgi:hypothetical protein